MARLFRVDWPIVIALIDERRLLSIAVVMPHWRELRNEPFAIAPQQIRIEPLRPEHVGKPHRQFERFVRDVAPLSRGAAVDVHLPHGFVRPAAPVELDRYAVANYRLQVTIVGYEFLCQQGRLEERVGGFAIGEQASQRGAPKESIREKL